MQRLREALLTGLNFGDSHAPDYIGKPLHIFSFKGQNLTHMQGGGYVLSRKAAMAVSTCELGQWRECPSSVFRDMKNAKANEMIRQRYARVCDDENTPHGRRAARSISMARARVHSSDCVRVPAPSR